MKVSPHDSFSIFEPAITHTLLFKLWKKCPFGRSHVEDAGFHRGADMLMRRTDRTQNAKGRRLNWVSEGKSPQWEYCGRMSLFFGSGFGYELWGKERCAWYCLLVFSNILALLSTTLHCRAGMLKIKFPVYLISKIPSRLSQCETHMWIWKNRKGGATDL